MGSPVLTPAEWAEVEKAAIAGVPYSKIAAEWGITSNAIGQRAHRFKWATPAAVQAAKAQLPNYGKSGNNVNDCKSGGEELSQILAETAAEYGKKGQLAVLKGLFPKLQETFDPSSSLLSQDITTWKDAGTMTSVFAKFAGLDKAQTAVQVNLWENEGGGYEVVQGE